MTTPRSRRAGRCPVPRAPRLLSAHLPRCPLRAGELSPVPSLGHRRPPQPLRDHTDAHNCPTETDRKPVSQGWSPRKEVLMGPALPAALTPPEVLVTSRQHGRWLCVRTLLCTRGGASWQRPEMRADCGPPMTRRGHRGLSGLTATPQKLKQGDECGSTQPAHASKTG